MNEFILWDNTLKTFLDKDFEQNEKIKNDSTYLFEGDDYYPICKMDFIFNDVLNEYKDRLIAFYNIGLKDINGKNIYADSSIFEFKNSQLWNKYNGIFFYNKERLCYQIRIIDGIRNNEIIPYDRYCYDFKIIDTIQENKLGLIKA